MHLKPEEINIRDLITDASGNYIDILQENKIEFKMEIHNSGTLLSDRNALEKIIFNLLSNAFKYTSKGGYIHLAVAQDISRNNALSIIIKNSGKGLTEQQMVEIFNKYKIFDRPNPGNSVSNGIGLNLTKNLAEALGGKIEVHSELGRYVEFAVLVPPLPAPAGDLSVQTNTADNGKGGEITVKELKSRPHSGQQ